MLDSAYANALARGYQALIELYDEGRLVVWTQNTFIFMVLLLSWLHEIQRGF